MAHYVIHDYTGLLRCEVPSKNLTPTEACYFAWRKWLSDKSVSDRHTTFEAFRFKVSLPSTEVEVLCSLLRNYMRDVSGEQNDCAVSVMPSVMCAKEECSATFHKEPVEVCPDFHCPPKPAPYVAEDAFGTASILRKPDAKGWIVTVTSKRLMAACSFEVDDLHELHQLFLDRIIHRPVDRD